MTPISFRPISLDVREGLVTRCKNSCTQSNPQGYPHGGTYQILVLLLPSLFVTRHCEAQGANNPLKHPFSRRTNVG